MPRRSAQHRMTGAAAAGVEADRTALAPVLAGDLRARGDFVERFARLVYSVVRRTSSRHSGASEQDLVEELFAEVFVALFDRDARRLRLWSGGCTLSSWVRLITASVTVDRLRRRRAEIEVVPLDAFPEALAWEGEAAIDAIVHAEELAAVGLALQRLSETDRALLVALCVDELAPADLAARLGVAPGVVYTRKSRALERLRKALVHDDGEAL